MNGLDIDFDKNYTETGKPFEIEDDKNNNENIKNGFAPIFNAVIVDCINSILFFYFWYIFIYFFVVIC